MERLASPPEGEPPVLAHTAPQVLPFDGMQWSNFEKLCYRLARTEAEVVEAREYGASGQADSGVDIYARLADGSYVAYQCKHHKTLTPAKVRDAVEAFLTGLWADRARRFILYTTASTTSTRLAAEIEAQGQRLHERRQSVEFVVRGQAELSAILKEHSDLVEDFFGARAAEEFVPGQARLSASSALEEIKDLLVQQQTSHQVVQLVFLDWQTPG